MSATFQSWDFDAPSGTFKSHALSERVLHASIARTQFMASVSGIDAFGRNRGETITIPRFSNLDLPTNARIQEKDDIPEDIVVQSTTSTTVVEWGRSLPYSSFNKDLSPLDLPSNLQRTLEKQMRLTLDAEAAAKFKDTLTKYIPTGVASFTFDRDGTPSSAAGSNLNFFHLETIRDELMSGLHVEAFPSGLYRGMLSTKAARGMKSDPKFETWNAPQNREQKVRGTMGTIEGIELIEVNNEGGSGEIAALRNDLGTGGVLGEAIFFGIDAVYMAVTRDIELMVAKLDPYGRRHGIAWYGIMEFGTFWAEDSAADGEANIIHVVSS